MELNLAQVHEAVAAAQPDGECIVHRERRLTWAQVTERTRRLANHLVARGLGAHRERSELAGWEAGQDLLAVYLHNRPEYLEAMVGAYKARVAPFNVNYRYVDEELLYLFRDAGARAVVYGSSFAPTLDRLRPELPQLEVLLQVDEGAGHPLLPGAEDYETALAAASPRRPDLDWSPDDLYVLYTGGTTGMPKGVLWRQADIFVAALGGRDRQGNELSSLEAVVAATRPGRARALPAPPFMHGASSWNAFAVWHGGGTVVIQGETRHLDPADVWGTVARERVTGLLIVGDAFARPLLEELQRSRYDTSSLKLVMTGGAPLSAGLKRQLLDHLPGVRILDLLGSSEAGGQGRRVTTGGSEAGPATFAATPGTTVLSDDLTRELEPGSDELGWLATAGRVPLGYLGDPDKTARTFPVVAGVRYAVPGDRARRRADGGVELHGRESATINSGGEKIFAEEVEHAVKHHPAVYDAVVVGRPSERWGQEVVALVRLSPGRTATAEELRAECARHLARYKLPKAFVFLDHLERSPSGKPDYRWAQRVAAAQAGAGGPG